MKAFNDKKDLYYTSIWKKNLSNELKIKLGKKVQRLLNIGFK